jgi:DNA ligase D-like protein (predicted ligase)
VDLFEEKIKPMLAFSSQPFDSEEWCFELKFDGTRCISYINTKEKSVKMLNRRMAYFEDRYPELQEMWKDVKGEKIILDGEVVVFHQGKPDFYKLAEREHVENKTRIEFLSKLIPATYIVFDILYKDGKDLTQLPLVERKKILEETVTESSRLVISQYVVGKGTKFFEEVKKKGLEGVMAKKLDSPYLIGERSKLWLKIKALETLDVIIVGYTTGTGKRGELLGSLITACYHEGKLKYVGKIGTGFSEEQLAEILKKLEKIKTEKCPLEEVPDLKLPPGREPVWVEPKLVCEAKFMNLSKDLVMRAPVFVRLREDKLSEECEL